MMCEMIAGRGLPRGARTETESNSLVGQRTRNYRVIVVVNGKTPPDS